ARPLVIRRRSLPLRSSKQQHAIAATEPKRMAERVPHLALAVLEPDLRPATRIELARVERARHEAGFERKQRDHRFENAGAAECVPGPALRRARASASGE